MNYLDNFNQIGGKHAGMGIQICSNKGTGPFWGPIRGKIRKILLNLLLMNHCPECIDIWHGTSLGQGDFVQMKSLGS